MCGFLLIRQPCLTATLDDAVSMSQSSFRALLRCAALAAIAVYVLMLARSGLLAQEGRRIALLRRTTPRVSAHTSISTVEMSTAVKERVKAAILGGLVADAASMPLHWIYKPEVMQAALAARPSSATQPEFHEPHACPFYQAPRGDLSPYGYELYALLKYIAGLPKGAAFDGNACAQSLSTSYKAFTGYLNKSSKHVVEAVAAGKQYPETGHPEDAQANAFVKAPAVVALASGSPALAAVATEAVRVQQNNDAAVAAGVAGAALLDKVVQGATVAEAAAWAVSDASGFTNEQKEQLKAALNLKDQEFNGSVAKLGLSCGLPGSFQNVVLGATKFSSFTEGVRANILAGGDNASRAVLLGALLAAQAGSVDAAIPAEWRAATNNYAEYEVLVDKVLA